MHVSQISNQNYNPNFNAKILNNDLWNVYKDFLRSYKGKNGYHNTARELKLINKFEKAINAHPSDATLVFSETYKTGYSFCQRGVIKSEYGKLTDIEPARDDDYIFIENLIRKLLNPENKDLFNRLMGTGYENKYDAWWNKHIRPIWSDIVETFREETVEASKNHPVWDEKMNVKFRNRNIEIIEPEPPKQRKGSTLLEFIKRMLRIK